MKIRYSAFAILTLAAGLLSFAPGCGNSGVGESPNVPASQLNGSDGGRGVDAKAKTQRSSIFAEPVVDGHNWRARWMVEKWNRQPNAKAVRLAMAKGLRPDEVLVADGNILCTPGITRMLNLLVGAGGQALDNTHARIGTGNSTTAVTAADTDLGAAAGSSNRWFQVMDATFPSVATNVATFKASFGSSDGNYVWNEFGIDAGTASGNTVTAPLLNHKISSLGTKTTGTWALTVTLTVT